MTIEDLTLDADDIDTDFLGDACLSLGDVVCLKSGGFAMTVEQLEADDEEDEFTEGYALCTWSKEDETIERTVFRTEMLHNLTAEDDMADLEDLETPDEAADLLAKFTGKPTLN